MKKKKKLSNSLQLDSLTETTRNLVAKIGTRRIFLFNIFFFEIFYWETKYFFDVLFWFSEQWRIFFDRFAKLVSGIEFFILELEILCDCLGDAGVFGIIRKRENLAIKWHLGKPKKISQKISTNPKQKETPKMSKKSIHSFNSITTIEKLEIHFSQKEIKEKSIILEFLKIEIKRKIIKLWVSIKFL